MHALAERTRLSRVAVERSVSSMSAVCPHPQTTILEFSRGPPSADQRRAVPNTAATDPSIMATRLLLPLLVAASGCGTCVAT